MLELLAGPFTIKNEAGVDVEIGSNIAVAWVDGYGLVVNSSWGAGGAGAGVVKIDGTFYPRANNIGVALGYDLPRNALLAVVENSFWGPGDLRSIDPVTFQKDDTSYITSTAVSYSSQVIKMPDRLVRMSGATVQASTDLGLTWTTETILTTTGNMGFQGFWGTTAYSDGLMVIGFQNGRIVFYDMVSKKQVGTEVMVDTSLALWGIWYSRKHDVFISLTNTAPGKQFHIWANSVRPFALSNPVALTSLLKGKVSTMQVRLTGSYGEACPDELINWSVTGGGTLLKTQSTTDASGYATVEYASPVDSTPSPQFTATMRF